MDFMKLSVKELRDGIKEKRFTSYEVTSFYLEEIEKKNSEIKAYISVFKEDALKRAKEIDERIKNGDVEGELLGVPIAIKDNICTDGYKTTCASKMLEDFVPPYDAEVISKLKKEGAVILGKTNMDEFAMGSSTENSSFMKTINPWGVDRVPGGSSGGSAAAVSSYMAPIAVGSDTGGSIRQPAAFCGIVGMKPTYGLVSRYGLIAFASSLDQIGPMGRSVEDCALLLSVLEGSDSKDNTSIEGIEKRDYLKSIYDGIKGMKIGVPKEFFGEGLDKEIKDNILKSAELFKELGAEVEEISLPFADKGLSAYYIISSAEASSNLARFDGLRYGYRTDNYENVYDIMRNSRNEGFGDEVKRRIMIGTYCLSSGYYDAYYKRAMKLKKMISDEFKDVFKKYDIILSPVAPVLPFKIGEKQEDPISMYLSDIYTVNINLAGLPALSMTCGFDSKLGLPIGLQLIGPKFGEEKIFKAAEALEKKLDIDLYEMQKRSHYLSEKEEQ